MALLDVLLFFNIGAPELFVIVLVVIIFFGSKKIPELMKGLGKGMREFKNATSEIQHEIRKSSQSIETEIKKTTQDIKTTEDIKSTEDIKDKTTD